MIDNLKYQTLQEIAGNIKHKLDNLLTGELSKSDLENLTEASRELFERLIVLRYKAYDGEVKEQVVMSAPIAQQQTPDTESLPEISFRLEETKAEEPLQISLIDAIEEVTKTEVNTHVPEETKVVPMITEPSKPAATVVPDVKESLHEKLSRVVAASESLADRMENNPIPDLKRAITLNQRFQFSRELFKGNNQDYEVAIDKLNNTTREDAMQQLASLRSKYAWSEESTVTTDFVELIARRYM